jgi:uncharacterized FAD-dependent dehydrogenase
MLRNFGPTPKLFQDKYLAIMQKIVSLKLLPSEAADPSIIHQCIAAESGVPPGDVSGYNILRQSIDARARQVTINVSIQSFIKEPYHRRESIPFSFKDVANAPRKVVIIGAGPAGLFAALKLIELGIKPVLLERGKDVRARRRDLARLNKEGEINPESNYCFGEGGAGTYSDGKLYTRSSKRGDVNRILQLFVHFGTEEKILYEAHPHIGTNKLPQVITAIRKQILDCGGEFHFEKKVVDFQVRNNSLAGVITKDQLSFEGDAYILATGHSARDIFELLQAKKIMIELKPFALGVRVEHPQELIDRAQYHTDKRDLFLPPASYSLVQQVGSKGVFSFCMCPGGIIAPAATAPGELVVNGWSPSKRNNPYANSGIVVTVDQKDLADFNKEGALAALRFQQSVEQTAFRAGGGKFVAPAQRLVDFSLGKRSADLPPCSYVPGVHSVNLSDVLPVFILHRLQAAFQEFGKKIRGYYSNDALVVATESRTSSPVRIPRHTSLLHHPQIHNLYPCAEGAGYAGGIVSAAMDGERVATMIYETISPR